ncbi:hypothetical protein RAS1_10500 [Phycisphaerae bacterium RAS1]|nr:hypothetical protein RAS1_10500 [Phycisphaerae bacterium RAS1]
MPSAAPIPPGFSTITPHLVIRNAAAAIEFYKKAFAAEEVMRMPGPDGKSVMHAELKIGNSIFMLADEFPDMNCHSPQKYNGSPVGIHLYVTNVDAAFKRAVDAGAKVTMPVTDMFWGDRYGKLTDPFGHEWSIATHTRDVTPEECHKAMLAMCSH